MNLIVPGINGSGPEHWQTLWEAHDPGFLRVVQNDWDHPEFGAWMDRLQQALEANPGSWIVAHSLGCLLVVSRQVPVQPRGAFLVAPPDPAGPEFPSTAKSFADIAKTQLSFPSLVVASEDDPYASIAFAKASAAAWGSAFVSVGQKGHINGASGLGFWDEGYQLFKQFIS
ncbi:MAG: alpha/beta hydrolase [Spirochaetia bacterium]|nr:alpha/beta hydrolase [Spirochaetia bacterium]